MAIRLHFWGAAQTVTGSSHHLECAGQNVLLDCGLFQGHRQQAREINEHLALPAEQLNAVVLSHAHIDHSGNLPLLDRRELLQWMEPVVPTLKKVFLVHGEPAAQQALKVEIERMYRLEVLCPERDERYEVG
jgi:Cft2 family RNA processing exonuclease